IMTTWQDLLVEYAKFPFPYLDTGGHHSSADISDIIAGQIAPEWKARRAVRDETLLQALCKTLENILGDKPFPPEYRDLLLAMLGRQLQFPGNQDMEARNGTEAHARALLDKGFLRAASYCLNLYGGHKFDIRREDPIGQGRHQERVDYTGSMAGNSLPPHGITLKWTPKRPPTETILQKAALYLGVKKMEWLFLTCHNYWIVCRLVKGIKKTQPFLAYSPSYSIENNSQPFRAFLGAILSTLNGVPVRPSVYNSRMRLDRIPEDREDGPLPEDDIDDSLGAYGGTLRTAVPSRGPITRSRAGTSRQAAGLGLMITSSSPQFPKSFQLWIHLRPLPANTFALPKCAENGSGKRRIWLTHFIGYGSTCNVWTGHFDNSDSSYAIKIVELLRSSDAERRERFCTEFEVYLTLEEAYKSGQLHDRITPHCYGAYRGDRLDALILEQCDRTLEDWDNLNISELSTGMVRDLHRVGIVHGDLEPRNITRVSGGFRLIDFSDSTRHTCTENLV
ncbi:hypothetical protein EDB87DRAFT_1554143, partial [Lactarius vividus]